LRDLWNADFPSLQQKQQEEANGFRDAIARAGGVYIWGAGSIGMQVLEECRRVGFRVKSFIESKPTASHRHGVEVKNQAALSSGEDVVVVTPGKSSYEIFEKLEKRRHRHVMNLSKFFFLTGAQDQPERTYLDELEENRLKWTALILNVADRRSREVLKAMIHHRFKLDVKAFENVYDAEATQWFDSEIIGAMEDAVFVDGGAFDGDTILTFRKMFGKARRIYGFEIDQSLAQLAQQRFDGVPEVCIYPYGLSDGNREIMFVESGATYGRIASTSQNAVRALVVALDEVVKEPITFLKLDVEGEEEKAIMGAEHHIKASKPVLAIAVYHRAMDPWMLAEQVSCLASDYQFYFRHYTQVGFETVLYGIPHADLVRG